MKFRTDFLLEDYSGLCWFQAKVVTVVLSALLAIALGATSAIFFGVTAGVALLVIGFPVIYWLRKRGVMRRAEKRFTAYSTSSELELTINEDEIIQLSNSGETRLVWGDVYAVSESKESYYVFLTKRKAFYFPKRSFETDEQRREFLSYIERFVPEKKVKIKK